MAPWKIDKWKEVGLGGKGLWPHAYRQQERDEMENTLSFKALGTAHSGDTNFLTARTVEE